MSNDNNSYTYGKGGGRQALHLIHKFAYPLQLKPDEGLQR